MHHSRIHWPEEIDEARFLAEYWQRKPLLIRQALPDFDTPLPADELAGLSLEPETTPRLITCDAGGAYHLEHGPFDAERFDTLTGNDWSLLVTDVEKHLPELVEYLRPFGFLPSWRIDDLMVSYAPVGASVGAHIDEYDVFLLQASGSRQWSIDLHADRSLATLPESELRILAEFNASDTWELQPGDLLYLPPGVPHHGVACEEPCTTWSIGFRAPSHADFVMRLAEMISERLPQKRYTDSINKPALAGEIDATALERFARIWSEAIEQNSDVLADLTGRFLTESANVVHESTDELDEADAADCRFWLLSPFSRVAWRRSATDSQSVMLYVDGEQYMCGQELAIQLSTPGQLMDLHSETLDPEGSELLQQLILTGSLLPAEQEAH